MGKPGGVALLVSFLALPLSSQDARRGIEEVLKEYGPALKRLEGVVDVRAGGTAEEPRILIRVSSDEVKAEVRKQVGESIGGYKPFVYAEAAPPGQTTAAPKPAEPQDKPSPPTKAETERTPLEDCDIMRDHLKLKLVTRHKEGKTIDGCRLLRRQRIGGGGGHSFWYTRHRADCPIRTGGVAKPKTADEFTEWVFTRGFQPAGQGSFLVFELKGDDKLWFEQVKEDLTSLLPYIREGSRWVSAKEEDAGSRWKWEVSK